MILNFAKVQGSEKAAHQSVTVDDVLTGEVWREQAHVNVSKLTEPRRSALKWRWFAKLNGGTATLGRGARVAMLMGPGFASKDKAVDALIQAAQAATNSPGTTI